MNPFNPMRPLHFVTVLTVVAAAFTLAACDNSAIPEGDYSAPLSLTAVQYVSPDSSKNPEVIRPGGTISLQGTNMNAVAHVFINGLEVAFNPALVTKTHLIVTVPADMPFGTLDPDGEAMNTIEVTNETSEAVLEIPVLPPAPQMAGMSNEYADPGEEVTIYGQYLYLVESVTFPDGTTVPGSAVESAPDGSWMTFTIPAKAAETEGAIEVTTISGTDASAPAFVFHDTRGLLLNMDDVQKWEWWSAIAPNKGFYGEYKALFEGSGAEGNFAIVTPADQAIGPNNTSWWTNFRSINFAQNTQWIDPAHLNEPLDHFAVKFEMAIDGEWSAGTFILRTKNESGWTYSARYEPWLMEDGSTASVAYEGWHTVTIPLSEFKTGTDGLAGSGTAVASLSTLLPGGVAPYAGIMLYNDRDGGAIPADLAFAVDNVRVVRIAE